MSIETITPNKGEIVLLWFNHYAGVTIKTPTKTLVIDPVDVDSKVFKTVDAILITHEHYDHLDQSVIRDIYARTQCKVIADAESAKRLRSVVAPTSLIEANVGVEFSIGKVKVRAERCAHPAAAPVTFLVTTEDNLKIYHTADSLPFQEMKRIGEENKLDIVFCTVGIAPGTSPSTAVEIAKLLQPKVAIPYHTAAKSDLNRFAELLAKEALNIKCVILEQGKPYKYP